MKRLKQFALISFFISVVMVFHLSWQRFCLGCSLPQAQILAFAHAYLNPNLFADDPMVFTRFKYLSLYPQFLAFLTKFTGSLELSVFANHIFWLWISMFFFYKLARRVFASKALALFCVAMLPLQYRMFYGHSGHWRTLFIHPGNNIIGFAFGVVALYFWQQKKKNFAGLSLALGCYFHSLSLVHLFLMLFGADLFDALSEIKSKSNFNWFEKLKNLRWALIFCAIAGPYLMQDAFGSREYNLDSIKTFSNLSGLDSFPLKWPIEVYLDYFSFLSLLLFCWFRGDWNKKLEALRWTLPIIYCSLILSCLGALGVHLLSSTTAIVLQLSRSSVWICCFGCLFISRTISSQIKGGWRQKFGCVFIFLALFNPSWQMRLVAPFFSIGLLLLMWRPNISFRSRAFVFSQILVLILWLLVVFKLSDIFIYTNELESYLSGPTVFITVVALLALATYIIYFSEFDGIPERFSVPLLLGSLMVSILAVHTIYDIRDEYMSDKRRSWKKLQLWVKDHSLPQDKFITPIWMNGFRIYSMRAPLVEWQDGTQQFFVAKYGDNYRERLLDLGIDPFSPISRAEILHVSTLGLEDLKKLRKKYGVNFYIGAKKLPNADIAINNNSPLPIVFEDESFKIWSLKGIESYTGVSF